MVRVDTIKRFVEARPKITREFVLVWLKQDGFEETIATWDKNEFEDSELFANTVIDRAQAHSDEEDLVCSYRFRSLNKDGKVLSAVRLNTKPNTKSNDVLGITPMEGNSALQQLVRVVEAQLRVQIAMTETFQKTYAELLREQRMEIMSLRKREEKATEFAFNLIEASTDEEKEVQKTQIVNKLGSVLEKVGEHILGTETETVNNKRYE